jgi:DNA primase
MKASLRGIDLILKEGPQREGGDLPRGRGPGQLRQEPQQQRGHRPPHGNAQDFLVFKATLLMQDVGDDPVKKAAAIHEIVESVSLVPDLVLRSLYMQQCSRLLQINEQALISEMNKVLRKQYRKKLGEDQPVPEELLAPAVRHRSPTLEDLGTTPQERDLLRMLLSYGHERITVPFQDEDGNTSDDETSVAELMFELLALDDILFDDPIFREIYLDYRHSSNLGQHPVDASATWARTGAWRSTAIDLLTEKHVLSPNWKERHKIHVKRESEASSMPWKKPWTS